MGHFKKLKAWEHARTLALLSKTAIARLPTSEGHALADQWRRASYSVVLNIAEGASRAGEAVRDECARTVFGLMRKLGDQRS